MDLRNRAKVLILKGSGQTLLEQGGEAFNETSRRALVLNSSYEPIKVVSWQKAIVLWFQDKVEIVEHHDVFVRSVCVSFQLPSIVRLKRYVRNHSRSTVRFCRENVYARDNYTCQYCHRNFNARDLTLDHVLPVSKGGGKSWTNVVAACRHCNQKKSNRTPDQAGMPLLKKPEAPRWLPDPQLEFRVPAMPDSWRIYLMWETQKAGTG